MIRYLTFILLLTAITNKSHSQKKPMEINLYPENKIPGNLPGPDEETSETGNNTILISKVRNPTLTIFLPSKEKANGTAVIICPGGGYSVIAIGHEGYEVAKRFTEMGIAAFVIKYRIPNKKNQRDPSIAPLQDAQQAIITVRKNSTLWNIDPSRIGIMGFSAGGHMASTAGTHFMHPLLDTIRGVNVRPDFMLLIYPVISADTSICHEGSFINLLGENASLEQRNNFSNEKQVTPGTPPTFLVHASDDKAVNPENTIVFYQALLRNKVPAEMHIYQNGGHGFGLHNATTKEDWFESCKNWLDENGWLKK
jgi:acetyl esterase/lipase